MNKVVKGCVHSNGAINGKSQNIGIALAAHYQVPGMKVSALNLGYLGGRNTFGSSRNMCTTHNKNN